MIILSRWPLIYRPKTGGGKKLPPFIYEEYKCSVDGKPWYHQPRIFLRRLFRVTQWFLRFTHHNSSGCYGLLLGLVSMGFRDDAIPVLTSINTSMLAIFTWCVRTIAAYSLGYQQVYPRVYWLLVPVCLCSITRAPLRGGLYIRENVRKHETRNTKDTEEDRYHRHEHHNPNPNP